MNNSTLLIKNVQPLDLALTFDCGQCFRWSDNGDGSFHGVVSGFEVDAALNGDDLLLTGNVKDDDLPFWKRYFDIDYDYPSVLKRISEDKYIKAAVEAYPGIRILRQSEWEALISFIISQNNNIPRIKGIITRLCENFGERINNDYTFPSPEVLSELKVSDLEPLRAGFRAKYIIDAAQNVASGQLNLEALNSLGLQQAREELKKIKGVGPKVAECVLLYGCGRKEAFPEDVWVKRIMSELYENGLPACADSVQGIAQQYLFHWRRKQ